MFLTLAAWALVDHGKSRPGDGDSRAAGAFPCGQRNGSLIQTLALEGGAGPVVGSRALGSQRGSGRWASPQAVAAVQKTGSPCHRFSSGTDQYPPCSSFGRPPGLLYSSLLRQLHGKLRCPLVQLYVYSFFKFLKKIY